MPRFSSEQLLEVTDSILRRHDVPPSDAAIVASELVEANLVGHDSHGVMRVIQYVDFIHRGLIRPHGEVTILHERATLAVIDGGWRLGQVIAKQGLSLAMTKARDQGLASVWIRNCNHVGRLGSYTGQGANDGLLAMMSVNTPGPGGVAPFGGAERRLGTNPISIAAPRAAGAPPIILDMTTSAVAEGKVRVALQKKESIPLGWIQDRQGNPSTSPSDLYTDPPGSLLPLGGPFGYKGFGLAVMFDILAGILSGSGVGRTDLPAGTNGVWMHVMDPNSFLSRSEYDAWIEAYVSHLKSVRHLPGVEEILLPGEVETRCATRRKLEGIEIPEETWRQLQLLNR